MNKVIFLLAFSLVCGCAGMNASSKIDIILDNQTITTTVGIGEPKDLRKESQFFIDWWQDVMVDLNTQVKQAEQEGDNTILQTKEIIFYDNYKIVVIHIYMKYSGGEVNLYAIVANKNHSYNIVGMLPIL